MKTHLFRFALYATLVYLTGFTPNPAVAASQPLEENGGRFCGFDDWQPDNRRYARTFANRETELLANYPNPFNPETWIPYHLSNDADVTLTIYNTNGAVVRQLDLGHQPAGFYTHRSHAAYWDGRNERGESVASGVYFYQLRAGDYSALRRMAIVK